MVESAVLVLSAITWVPSTCEVPGWGGLVREKCEIMVPVDPCYGRGPSAPWWCHSIAPRRPK